MQNSEWEMEKVLNIIPISSTNRDLEWNTPVKINAKSNWNFVVLIKDHQLFYFMSAKKIIGFASIGEKKIKMLGFCNQTELNSTDPINYHEK